MALADDVIGLAQDLSSAGLAVTLIGAPARTAVAEVDYKYLTESKSSEHSKSNSPTRDPANEEHNIDKDEDKKQKYSTIAEEVCPTRDREYSQKKLPKNIDVRNMNEITSFNDKITTSYILSCNQHQCPIIQKRLNQHQHDHHSVRQKADEVGPTRKNIKDQAINVSPTLSRMRLPKFNLPLSDHGRTVQTEITMSDFSPNCICIPKSVSKMDIDVLRIESKEIPLKKSETRDVLSTRNFYKQHLQNEILNWLQSVPLFYTSNFTIRDIKDKIVNNLLEKINTLAVEAYDKENYEIKTKTEIENTVSRLPMWLHGSKRDQLLFKDSLKEKLWSKIQELNQKFLGVKYEKAVEYEQPESVKLDDWYEKEVLDWSQKLQLDTEEAVTRKQVVDSLMKRLSPLLKKPFHTTSYKLILKGEIIDILDDLPLTLSSPRFKTVQLNRFAEELANRLLNIQIKHASSPDNTDKETTVFHQCTSQIAGLPLPEPQTNLKRAIVDAVSYCLDTLPVSHRSDLEVEICSTFLDLQDCLRTSDEINMKNEICQFIRDTGKLSVEKTLFLAKMIIKEVNEAIKDLRNSATTIFDSVMPELSGTISVYKSANTSFDYVMPELSGTISVYRWGSEKSGPVTSTPKKPSKKEIPKLNVEERAYMKKVADLIRTWMDTLPKQYNEDQNFKETIINDLAGDLMDELKVEQLSPETSSEREKYQNYLMYRWLYRFEFFEDAKIRYDAKPFIADFLTRLKKIEIPTLTAPQHGTRQAMKNIKHMQGEQGWQEDYVPQGIDVLEDQISVWMNEQPSEIYNHKDKGKRDKMVHDLALNLQDHLRNKSPEEEIEKDINQWLKKVVKPKEKEHIGLLSQNLKDKVRNIPQDQTLEARNEERKRYMVAKLQAKRQMKEQTPTPPTQDVSNVGNIEGDPDKTIREFIAKYIEHNFNIDDPLAKGVFSHLLKTELRKLSPTIRNEIYENFDQSKPHNKLIPENLKNELEYIKIISDWLKNIPIDQSYNTPGNKARIEFVNDLSKNIQEIEQQKLENPDAMEYNYLMASMILQSMNSYELPILPEYKDNTPLMAEQLLFKISEKGPSTPSHNYTSQALSPEDQSTSQSLNASDIKEQNLSEFIEDYIRVNGRDIADDPMKLEAWTARLLKEIKKMVQEGADPETLSKAKVYEKFSEVSIPTDEAVRRFGLEMAYVKEISDWMKNLSLLPLATPQAEDEKILMISELAQKMSDREELKRSDPNDSTVDNNLEKYIGAWIPRLPLDKSKEIDVLTLTKQLMNRMKKVNKSQPIPESSCVGNEENEKRPKNYANLSKTLSLDAGEEKSNKENDIKTANVGICKKTLSKDRGEKECFCKSCKDKGEIKDKDQKIKDRKERNNKSMDKKYSKESVSRGESKNRTARLDKTASKQSIGGRTSKDKSSFTFCRSKKTPAEIIVEAIEDWSSKLPIKGDDKEGLKSMKQDIARKLYQKVGELNVDPRIFNDDLLYKDILGDEIDTQLENVPQNSELQKNREKLKEGLLNTILKTNKIIKEKSAGDNYKHKLESTIDSSIPHPVQSTQVFDPGFEIYKNHLANMFILENFDHANDDVKAKYEKRIKNETDKYFESARNKNALPLTKDQMYNELYSALFKVPMPNEVSVIDEVEQVKTRCEVDAWFEGLPVKQTDDIIKLLEWDKILSTLTKRIHEIEKANECQSEKKIQKEISKWLEKLPLLSEHRDIDNYANKLVNSLKSTAKDRKYVATDPKAKGKSKQVKENKDKDKKRLPNTSQVAGPSAAGQSQSKSTTAKPCMYVSPMAQKKPGDIILEVVEEWCNRLPLISTEQNNKAIRDNLSTRIIIHISELNMDPEIFNDDEVYDELLDEELDNVMSNLPVSCDFAKNKAARKYALKEIIKSIRPLIKQEKARHEYKEELNNTVTSFLKEPKNTPDDKIALFNKLKDEIVENFVQYKYNGNDEEGRQLYKKQVHDAVVKYCIEIRDNSTEEKIDPLVRRNQLLCELGKIPVPYDALKEEVEEIKMRQEVDQLFLKESVPEGDVEDKMRRNLAKRLCDIEKTGHNSTNDNKMKSDITRCFKKLKKDVTSEAIEGFVNSLKSNEAERKAPPLTSSEAGLFRSCLPGSPRPVPGIRQSADMYSTHAYPQGQGMGVQHTFQLPQETSQSPQQSAQLPQETSRLPQQTFQVPQQSTYSQVPCNSVDKWVSSPPITPAPEHSTGYLTSYAKEYKPEIRAGSPYAAHDADQSLNHTPIDYQDFEDGLLLSSSVAPQAYAQAPERQGYNGFTGASSMCSSATQTRRLSSNDTIQQGHRSSMREAASGPMLSHPCYGQMSTPRQVAQSPHQVSQTPTRNATSAANTTPEFLFPTPVFKPHLHRPLPVPVVEPVPLRGSVANMHARRRSFTDPLNAPNPPHGVPMTGHPTLENKRFKGYEAAEEEEEICRCERCARTTCRGRPVCMISMDECYDECAGYGPMACRGMHFPECFY